MATTPIDFSPNCLIPSAARRPPRAKRERRAGSRVRANMRFLRQESMRDARKTAGEARKSNPRASKIGSPSAWGALPAPKCTPGAPKSLPRPLRGAPRSAPGAPQEHPKGPKTAPGSPKGRPGGSGRGSGRPKCNPNPPTLSCVLEPLRVGKAQPRDTIPAESLKFDTFADRVVKSTHQALKTRVQRGGGVSPLGDQLFKR